MDAADLRVFEAVARLGAMNRAAAGLNTVQSNVSALVRRLEQALAAPLFDRRSSGVGATAAFALGQAGAAYGFSFRFAETGVFAMLFALGAAALVLALAIDLGTIGLGARLRIS